MIVTGRSTLGKTTLSVDIILERIMPGVRQVFAVCPTFWSQPAFSRLRHIKDCFTRKNVFTKVNDAVFEFIHETLVRQGFRIPTLLIIDDAAAERATNVGNKGSFSRLCIASPHINLTMVGVFQRLTSASPSFRDNTECLISFTPSRLDDIVTIYKEFNPCPFSINSKNLVYNALEKCWNQSSYCFIFRPNRIANVYYFSGFNFRVVFPCDNRQQVQENVERESIQSIRGDENNIDR